jgi:hypothetical protein
LRGALKNDQDLPKPDAADKPKEKPAEDVPSTEKQGDETKGKPSEDGDKKETEKDPVDYQLLRALDLLNGLSLYQGSENNTREKQVIKPATTKENPEKKPAE